MPQNTDLAKLLQPLGTIFLLDVSQIAICFQERQELGNKGTFGHCFLVGGSFGRVGSIAMSGRASLRAGAGLATFVAPACANLILQQLVPEAMYLEAGDDTFSDIPTKDIRGTIAVGPGYGTDDNAGNELTKLLIYNDKPMVLDADALNIISKNEEMWQHVWKESIITPHIKEFDRLFGDHLDVASRFKTAAARAAKHQVVIVLKDAKTVIFAPDGEIYYNVEANSGLAKGGNGDVLTGIIAGILAQGYTPAQAAQLGVWLQVEAAKKVLEVHTVESMLPTDVIESLSKAFYSIHAYNNRLV